MNVLGYLQVSLTSVMNVLAYLEVPPPLSHERFGIPPGIPSPLSEAVEPVGR
jgi:hypothetical protein